jgi:hypothetical protein
MMLLTYTALFVVALGLLALSVLRETPIIMMGIQTLLWLALVPSAYNIQVAAGDGTIATQPQPVLAFIALGGVGVSVLLTLDSIMAGFDITEVFYA